MTESTKKILFGNSLKSIALKIGVHCTLQYIEEKKCLINVITKKENKTPFSAYFPIGQKEKEKGLCTFYVIIPFHEHMFKKLAKSLKVKCTK